MKEKRNLFIIAGFVLLAVALLFAAKQMRVTSGTEESIVVITVDGAEYARIPLSQPQRVVITQKDGRENVVVVTERGAYMESSSCDNQLCVHMGEVTLDNWETRPNQSFVICLPNLITVELLPAEQ